MGQVMRRDRRPEIRDGDRDHFALPCRFDGDHAALGGVAHRILEQVRDDLRHLVGIDHGPESPGHVDLERKPVRLRRWAGELDGGPHHMPHVRVDRAWRGGNRGLRQRVERRGESDEALRLLQERLERGPIRRDDVVTQSLEVALEVREGRAQFMRRVLDQLLALSLLVGERAAHRIERIGQAHQLLGSAPLDARLEVAGGNAPRRPAQVPKRPGDPAAHHDRERRCGDDRCAGREREHRQDGRAEHPFRIRRRFAEARHEVHEEPPADDADPDCDDGDRDDGHGHGGQGDSHRDAPAAEPAHGRLRTSGAATAR